jgi:hypothetical protein
MCLKKLHLERGSNLRTHIRICARCSFTRECFGKLFATIPKQTFNERRVPGQFIGFFRSFRVARSLHEESASACGFTGAIRKQIMKKIRKATVQPKCLHEVWTYTRKTTYLISGHPSFFLVIASSSDLDLISGAVRRKSPGHGAGAA